MKFFMRKGFTQKLIIAIVAITLLNFCFVPSVHAKVGFFGGEMMKLIRDFAKGLGDAAASVAQLAVTGEWHFAVDREGTGKPDRSGDKSEYWIKEDNFQYPILQVSPELIFAGEIELLDVNFISDVNSRSHRIELKDDSGLKTLRNVVASWYVTLRTIAVVRPFISSYIYGN